MPLNRFHDLVRDFEEGSPVPGATVDIREHRTDSEVGKAADGEGGDKDGAGAGGSALGSGTNGATGGDWGAAGGNAATSSGGAGGHAILCDSGAVSFANGNHGDLVKGTVGE